MRFPLLINSKQTKLFRLCNVAIVGLSFLLLNGVELHAQSPFQKVDTTKGRVKIKYKNQNTSIDLVLDPNDQEFNLEFNGRDLVSSLIIVDSTKKSGKDVNSLTSAENSKMLRFYRLSQDEYYKKAYDRALSYVDSSLYIAETSEALGLKGSIFFTKGEIDRAKRNWEMAKKIDPNFKTPVIYQKNSRQ